MQREGISDRRRALAGLLRLFRPAQRRANWQYLSAYWSLRQYLSLSSFKVLRKRHSFEAGFQSSRESAQILFLILRSVRGAFLSALLLVSATSFVELSLRRLARLTAVFASRWAAPAAVYQWLRTLSLQSNATASLLGTLAQIAGVLLGLYFAVVGTLVSTRYADVPPRVRELLVADKLGNQYIRLVAVFGAVAILLLAAQGLSIPFGLLNLTLVTFLGVATILSFVMLGRRAFEFFDPGTLVHELGAKLVGWINRASRLNYFGRQPAFQTHYQKQAESLLVSYDGVVKLSARDDVSQQHTLPTLAKQTLGILMFYSRRKSKLVSDSFWFRRQSEHKNWLTTSYTETSMALQTGTTLQPKAVPDLYWFEKDIAEIFWFAYKQLIESSKLDQTTDVSLAAAEALGEMGQQLLVTEAVQFWSAWAPFVQRESAKTKLTEPISAPEQRDLLQRLGILDCYALGSIKFFLSFVARLSGSPGDQFLKSLSEPDWLQRDRIYELNGPRQVVIELEHLRRLSTFEREVEARVITPPWYFRQRIAFAYCTWYRDSLNAMLAQFESAFGSDLEMLQTAGCWLAAAHLSSRGLEGCNKFRHHLTGLKYNHEQWMEWRGKAEGEWPTTDWQAASDRIIALEERIEIVISALLLPLSSFHKSDVLPDFFGQALGTSTQACFEAIAFGREKQFAKTFPPLLIAGLTAFNRLKNELKDSSQEASIVFSTEPIEDLMELSGYALVYAELDGKDMWSKAKTVWDAYFAACGDAGAVAKWLATVISFRRSRFAMNPGDMQRSGWKQHFEHDMRSRGLLEERWHVDYDDPMKHSSPIIRALLRGGHVFSDMADVFLVKYFLKQSFAAGVPVSPQTEQFGTALEREKAETEETTQEEVE